MKKNTQSKLFIVFTGIVLVVVGIYLYQRYTTDTTPNTGVYIETPPSDQQKNATKTAIRTYLPHQENGIEITYDYGKQDVVVMYCGDVTIAQESFNTFLKNREMNPDSLESKDLRFEIKQSCL